MNDSKIWVRYAKALFLLAKEKGMMNTIRKDILFLSDTFRVKEFDLLVKSPVIKTSQKKKIVNELFKTSIQRTTLTFLEIIFQNKREVYLPAIARNFLDMYRKEKGVKKATLITAVVVEAQVRERIKKMLKDTFNTEVELLEQTKPEIIGGFVLRIEDKQYDASVSNKLQELKRQFEDESYISQL